ncbi:MAG: galactose-1-phosphate uridylyltransferase [Thermodesulfobacteriota bacterium]
MNLKNSKPLTFKKDIVEAEFKTSDGKLQRTSIEIRIDPITGRTSRIAFSRSREKEPGTKTLPQPPPDAFAESNCPFCPGNVLSQTPTLRSDIFNQDRLCRGESILFPNLFPYGAYSAVSLIGSRHFVEIGTASPKEYTDSMLNCINYLKQINKFDKRVCNLAITQNHLPSAGGSLVHPHLQINAEVIPANYQLFFRNKSAEFQKLTNRPLFSEYIKAEKRDKARYIGKTGRWEWCAAFAPEGFFEIWAILPDIFSMFTPKDRDWADLCQGIINVQKFYRSLNRNGYNLGLISYESSESAMELRLKMLVRSNHAAWVRNDHTGFEVMLGDMVTFTPPEDTALAARSFF